MKQTSLGLGNSTKRMRKREFLAQMERVVPWAALVELVAPFAPEGRRGRPPFSVEIMLRARFMQQWFTLSDPAMEEALHDVPLFREFAGLGGCSDRLSDELTIFWFRHLLEKHKLAEQMLAIVNDMKAHIGVDAESGLVHTVRGSSGNVNDVVEGKAPLHGEGSEVLADAGYQGAHKRADAREGVTWHVAMRPGKRAALDNTRRSHDLIDELERLKASIRAKVEHPLRVIKRQFGHVKVRYRGLKNNTAPLSTLFALSNLWMVRKTLQVLDGQIRAQPAKAA